MGLVEKRSPELWKKAEKRVQTSKLLSNVRQWKFLTSSQATRLTVAFGESYILRKCLMPVLVPLKFWIAVQAVLSMKKPQSS